MSPDVTSKTRSAKHSTFVCFIRMSQESAIITLGFIAEMEGLILGNDQRDAHLLYFTIYLLHSSTCFEHFMLIISIMSLNCIDAASGIVLSVSGRPVHRK